MRKPGYSVKITCFIEANPTDMDQMRLAISAIDAACEALRQDGFQMVKSVARFMLSREVPDAADVAQALTTSADGLSRPLPTVPATEMPPIPPGLRRA